MIDQPDNSKRPQVFPVWSIRVTNAGVAVHGVKIVLPGQTGTPDSERQPNNIYIEDYLPDPDFVEHHTVLGKFVDSWSQLEIAVASVLFYLLQTDSVTASAVFNTLGMKQVMDIIRATSTIKLNDQEILNTTNLLERLSKINKKRNVIVHGQWTIEFVIWSRRGIVMHKLNLLREVIPVDYRLRDKIANLKNQKERIKHTFNIRRIMAASLHTQRLAADVGEFTEKCLSRLMPQKPSDGT